MTTPIAASSSRMRSDSLKSFRARAAVRSEIRPSICFASSPLACCFRFLHAAALSDKKPSNRNEPENALRSFSFPDAALFLRPCNDATICGVFRSSDKASMMAECGSPPGVSAATQYQSSSVFAVSSSPFNVQSRCAAGAATAPGRVPAGLAGRRLLPRRRNRAALRLWTSTSTRAPARIFLELAAGEHAVVGHRLGRRKALRRPARPRGRGRWRSRVADELLLILPFDIVGGSRLDRRAAGGRARWCPCGSGRRWSR